MKKLLSLLILTALLVPVFVSCQKDAQPEDVKLIDGTYNGSGSGRSGKIVVAMTVLNRTILDIVVLAQCESDFAVPAETNIINQVLEKQSVDNLDAVSGATLTSKGTIAAVTEAYNKAAGKSSGTVTYSDCKCDVVVIGSGGAGMSAAITAAGNGADVIILEKQGIVGGNSNYSTGGINAAETSVQAALGIVDSKQSFYDDTMKGGHFFGKESLVKALTDKAASAVDWLVSLGANLSDVGKLAGSSVARSHRPKGGAAIGAHLVKVLEESSVKHEIPIRLENKVTGLITETATGGKSKVCGVNVTYPGGSYKITAKSVIIATGGFGANLTLVTKLCPELAGFPTSNHPGATGDAFEWAMAAGADTLLMNKIQIHPTGEKESHILITEAVRGNGAILVNAAGKRFANEMLTRDLLSDAILKQEDKTAYLIFDDGIRKSLKAIENYVEQGLAAEGETIAQLAQFVGFPNDALVKTVDTYNGYQKAGLDKDFGRAAEDMPRAIQTSPFYAIAVTPLIHHTMGGLRINEDAQVLRKDGSIIEGLFAAGEVTGGVHGDNRLGGNGVADIIVFGRIAGNSAFQRK